LFVGRSVFYCRQGGMSRSLVQGFQV
jgi:hypothetical protein